MICWNFSGATGIDRWKLLALFWAPLSWRARIAARSLLRGPFEGADPETSQLYLRMEQVNFRILDSRGKVREESMPAELRA